MQFPSLFTPVRLGAVELPNRILMAPLTRLRSDEPGDVPTELMGLYYRQRASAGLIISEATQISFEAKGYAGAPGIHTPGQIEAWKRIVDGVHEADGRMAVQLWHTGRVSHRSLQPDHRAPGAPSAVVPPNTRTSLRGSDGLAVRVETTPPRELTVHEIREIVRDFGTATANAREAGFDLVELHGAHGYLIQQFMTPEANLRTDEYGGSAENRVRFALEVADAAVSAWSGDRVGYRIYPSGGFNGVENGEDQEQATLYLVRELAKRQLAYLHISEPDWVGGSPLRDDFRHAIRDAFPNTIIGAGAYTPEKAEDLISRGLIDAVAFGRRFIANPDLPERIARGGPFNELRAQFNQGGSEEGYTDYPPLRANGTS